MGAGLEESLEKQHLGCREDKALEKTALFRAERTQRTESLEKTALLGAQRTKSSEKTALWGAERNGSIRQATVPVTVLQFTGINYMAVMK